MVQAHKLEAVGQLTGGLAHDFNNLLTAILGSLEIARKRAIRPDVLDLIENAIQGAQRGATLTQRLLAFARRQELKIDSLRVPDLVGGMADLMRRTIGPEVVINTAFPADLPPRAYRRQSVGECAPQPRRQCARCNAGWWRNRHHGGAAVCDNRQC